MTLDELLAKKQNPIDARPATLHVRGLWQMSYWEKVKMAFKFLFGATLHYSFCNTVEPSITEDGQYLGMAHAGSTAQIVVSVREPEHEDIKKLDPVTHIRVVKTLD